jgi:5-methyltetrahydropteroyltriglutamate--homocysteine methyltransferase
MGFGGSALLFAFEVNSASQTENSWRKTMPGHILTTHVGSLPRSADVTDLIFAQERGEAIDPAQFDYVIGAAVDDAVARQVAAGVDLVSDGEMSKISYATYIKDRITGFDGDSPRTPPQDLEMFPGFLNRQDKGGGTPSYRRPKCVGEIRPKTLAPLEADLKHMAAALAKHSPAGGFMNAASPGVIALFQPNEYYPSQDAYLEALAEAMRPEYEAIVAAGLYLQLDSPDLGLGRHMMYKDRSDEEYLRLIGGHVEALNHALRNVPADRVRMHVCWGNYEGPHCCDVEMGLILPTLMSAKPAALLFETSNPRHQADWNDFADMVDRIPDDKILIPGVIDSTTNFIEHPRVVAERIERYANIVGRERVIAGTDCGFSTFAGFGVVDPDIVYAKLKTLSEGAALASERLWKNAA